MKNRFLLFLAFAQLISQIHAYSPNLAGGFMTEDELMASLEAYVNSSRPSSPVNRDEQKQVIQAHEAQQEPAAQNVGAFAGGSVEGQLEEIVEEAGRDIEEEDNEDDDTNDSDDHEYHTSKKLCNICGKPFVRLTEHLATHTGEKRLQCKICKKKFIQGNELKSHMRTHTGERPYKCKKCVKGFTQKCNLTRHMKVHAPVKDKPFKCDICNRGFAEKHQVDEHVWTHSSKKRFKCETCGKGYARKSTLINHMKSHE